MDPVYALIEEWVFTAQDKDNGDVITDVHNFLIAKKKSKEALLDIISDINVRATKVGNALESYVNNQHPVCSITGNKWSIEEFGPTGKRIIETTTKEVFSNREREEEYPIMKMS
jgi:hypothetical protein